MKTANTWDQYRKRNGEFRYWLHEFWWRPQMIPIEPGSGEVKLFWNIQNHSLPWIFPRSPHIDGQELKAFYNMGYFKNAPEPWPQWRPADDVLADLANQSTYGVILDRQSVDALIKWLSSQHKRCDNSGRNFKAHVLDKHVLFHGSKVGDRKDEDS